MIVDVECDVGAGELRGDVHEDVGDGEGGCEPECARERDCRVEVAARDRAAHVHKSEERDWDEDRAPLRTEDREHENAGADRLCKRLLHQRAHWKEGRKEGGERCSKYVIEHAENVY